MLGSAEYDHSLHPYKKKKSSVHGLVLSGEVQDLQI